MSRGRAFWAVRRADGKIPGQACVCCVRGVERLPAWLKPSKERRPVIEDMYCQIMKGPWVTMIAYTCTLNKMEVARGFQIAQPHDLPYVF